MHGFSKYLAASAGGLSKSAHAGNQASQSAGTDGLPISYDSKRKICGLAELCSLIFLKHSDCNLGNKLRPLSTSELQECKNVKAVCKFANPTQDGGTRENCAPLGVALGFHLSLFTDASSSISAGNAPNLNTGRERGLALE